MTARDNLAALLYKARWVDGILDGALVSDAGLAKAILTAGYRKVFDGDCGLSNIKDPTEREAAEAWMRWANLAMNDEIGGILAMKQMLTEFGYRKHRTITTTEEVDALPDMSIAMTPFGDAWTIYRNNPLIPAERFHGLVEHGPATVLHEPEAES